MGDDSIASADAREHYERITKIEVENEERQASLDELPATEYLRRQDQIPGLFDYQEELAEKICELATQHGTSNIGLVSLPTGGGKTRTAVFAVLRLLEKEYISRILWLAPGKELLDQAFETARFLWSGYQAAPNLELVRCHTAKGFPRAAEKVIYFCTPQMLASRTKPGGHSVPTFDFLLFDEAHHSIAPAYRAAFEAVRNSTSKNPIPAVGLSATPGRADDESTETLVSFFQKRLLISEILAPNALESLRSRGVLAKIAFEEIKLARELVGQRRRLTSSLHLGKTVRHLETDKERFRAVVSTTADLSRSKRVLVFAGSVAHASAITAVLQSRGCAAEVVSHKTPQYIRDRMLRRFKSGEIPVLVNRSILATGFDCPAVDSIVLSMPVGSPILFEQIVGRASRGPAVGGTELGTIYEIDDHRAIHGLPQSYHRFEDFDWTTSQ